MNRLIRATIIGVALATTAAPLAAEAQSRREHRQDRRDDRRDHRQDRREDRREYRQERRDDRRDWRQGDYDSRRDYRQDRRQDRREFRQERRDDAERVMKKNFPDSKYLNGNVTRDKPWWVIW